MIRGSGQRDWTYTELVEALRTSGSPGAPDDDVAALLVSLQTGVDDLWALDLPPFPEAP